MNWRILLAMMATLAPIQARADLFPPAPTQPSGQMCRQAIVAAERAHGIPPHLLAAIARVESGRRDQASGTYNPWPWTINFDGAGSFYESKPEAVATAATLRPRVTRSIDVGCMQISLTYHPDAFANMDQAFDPRSNADYGARFLLQLYEKTGSWPRAVELYHSATPDLGADYRQKVYAILPEETKLAEAAQPTPLAAAWASTLFRSTPIGAFRQAPVRIIPQPIGLGGEPTPGRSLDAYRAAPVRFAYRLP
jgi:soluble lytic murein transglycosylase-like protein